MKRVTLGRWSLLAAILAGLVSTAMAAPIFAHGGGTPRLTSVPVGPYRLYAWSEPEPWRVGEVHLSLAVTKPNLESDTNQVEIPVTDVDITVTFAPVGDNADARAAAPIVVKAVRQELLSDFYFEADPTLPLDGDWLIHIAVKGAEGSGETEFSIEALPARSTNWTLVAGAGGVFVVLIVLIAIWSRAQQSAQPVRRPQRGVRRAQPRSSQAGVRKEA
jgi:hypothetical protein